jgi:hypothetical protein
MRNRSFLVLLFVLIVPASAGAYETDQFSNRNQVIADSTSLMNRQVNLAIAHAITGKYGPRDDMQVVNGIYNKIGGKHWVDKIERWAMETHELERLDTGSHESIYKGHPIWATRVASLFGVGATINIDGVLVGTDKFGHFLSQGRKFYRRWLRMNDESKAAKHSAYTERALFGQMTTGSYSNADLVANYEGYRFYRSLFEDNIIAGKPPILEWKGDHWIMQRPFDWSDHVNDFWDEALNVNHYDKILYPHMKERLLTMCEDYLSTPELFVIHDEAVLQDRYRQLQLRDTSELRLSSLCNAHQPAATTQSNLAGSSH